MKLTKTSYRQWQKRNTRYFNALSKVEQKQLRRQGYFNRGWDAVKASWELVKGNIPGKNQTIHIMDYYVKKFECGEMSTEEFDNATISLMHQIVDNRKKDALATLEKFQEI